MRSAGHLFLNNPVNFVQFIHQVFPAVETSGRIDQKNIHAAGSGRLKGVIRNRSRICPFLVLNDGSPCPLRPDAQLLSGCCPKCVPGGQHNLFAFLAKTVRQFTNGGCFAYAIHSHHHNHCDSLGLNANGFCLAAQDSSNLLFQDLLDFLAVLNLFFFDFIPDPFHQIQAGSHSHIALEQNLLQSLKKFLVNVFRHKQVI